jgi:hypothetical protein
MIHFSFKDNESEYSEFYYQIPWWYLPNATLHVVNNCIGSKFAVTTVQERKSYKSLTKIQKITQETLVSEISPEKTRWK